MAAMYESKKVKRYRSAFTTSQVNYLERQFEKCPYIGSAARKEVANLLNIPERAIKIWFQNRRMKEKKEVNSTEYSIDNHNKITNDMKFAKDPLVRAHSSQSTNDGQCSLPTVMKHDTANFLLYYNNSTFPNQFRNHDLNKETTDNHKPYKIRDGTVNIRQKAEKTSLSEPENLMKYNSNNKYNNKNFIKYLELNKRSLAKTKVTTKKFKLESASDKMNVTSTLTQSQDMPEDLSARNMSNGIIPHHQQNNVQFGSAYIPFCNTQDVCISTGNVLWKPVNVMPAISPNAIPVTIPDLYPAKQNNVQECKCNCTCQSRNKMNYNTGNVKSQYVIAIPYNNNMNILR